MKKSSPTTIWFDREGENWFDGLPLGNGRTGAMIVGGLTEQIFHLNDETFWSPGPRERDLSGARDAMGGVRERLSAGDVLGAQAIAAPLLGRPSLVAALQPVGDLLLSTGFDVSGAVFARSLDLATGVVAFSWEWPDGGTVTREAVAARSPSVFLVRQSADAPVGTTRLGLSSPFGTKTTAHTSDTIIATGQWHEVARNRELVADSYRLRNYADGTNLRFAVGARALAGAAQSADDSLDLVSPNWTIAIAIGTDFAGLEPTASITTVLGGIHGSTEELFEQAITTHSEVFDRAQIRLAGPGTSSGLTTDRRIHAVRAGGIDDNLTILLSEYGRYLQIASTLGGDLPPTLQGIWNVDTEPAWGSGWTLNINLQMALWSASAFGFIEAMDILHEFVGSLATSGRRTAREIYGSDGWVSHNNSDLWMNTGPTTLVEVGLFAASGPWLLQQLWQHHLRYPELANAERLFSLVEGAVTFFETWLVQDTDGYLATSPSSTPENGYLLGDTPRPRSRAVDPEFWRHGWLGQAPTLDMLLVRDTLRTAIELGEQLHQPEERVAVWKSMLARLRPVPILDGEIPEWTWPYRALELGHRHLSPLYGLYPGTDDFTTPSEWREAATRTLENRLANVTSSSNGWGGWSRVWAAAAWARLGDGERALSSIDSLTRTGIAPDSLLHAFPDFDGHPARDAVHQSDANLGLAAAVSELLIHSRSGQLDLLPALPGRWLAGSLRGIRAEGGITVEFEWSDGLVASAVLTSVSDQEISVSVPRQQGHARISQSVILTAGRPVTVSFDQPGPHPRGATK